MKTFIATLMAVSVFTATAQAQVSDFYVQPVDPGTTLPGFVSNDLFISFNGQYQGSQLLITLTQGTIYQDSVGSSTPPNSAFFGVFPALQYDTFTAQGGPTSDDTLASITLGGGAVNVGGPAAAAWTSSTISQSWFPSPGQFFGGPNDNVLGAFGMDDLMVARITLSDDAQGEWRYFASANDVFFYAGGGTLETVGQPIVNGMMIPEPASMALLALGAMTMLARRRNTRKV